MMRRRSLRPLVVLALLSAACARDAQKSEPQSGSSHFLLTDAPFPFDRLKRVDIHIVSVAVSYGADTAAGAGEWITVAEPDRTFDLLALDNGATTELGSLALPTGLIQAVRMVIDTDKSSLTLKDGRVLAGGDGAHGGVFGLGVGLAELNALIHENVLAVPDSGAVIVIDYDLSLALYTPQMEDSTSADSSWTFMRQFRAVDAARTGTITGVVRAHSADGQPVRDAAVSLCLGHLDWTPGTWLKLHLARTDSTGSFRIPYVTRTSFWADTPRADESYIVLVEPPTTTGLGSAFVPDLTVEAGQTVALGTVVVP